MKKNKPLTSTERSRKYRLSMKGTINTTYDTLVKGNNKRYNVEICNREEFYEWAVKHPVFLELWEDYLESGRQINKKPSIIRVSSKGPYIPLNLEWGNKFYVRSLISRERHR